LRLCSTLTEFKFKKLETGKGNPFREDKKVSSKHILKRKLLKN
jgi:hypothetical protein